MLSASSHSSAAFAAGDPALILRDFFGEVEVGSRSVDGGESVAIFLLESRKIAGSLYSGLAAEVDYGNAVADIHHVALQCKESA